MENKYFRYLRNIVADNERYDFLLWELFHIEFYHWVPNDQNRASDGAAFRDVYYNERGPQALCFLPTMHCTVLEMLIGLSFRLEWELFQSEHEKTPKEWFWILIDNLELTWAIDIEGRKKPAAKKIHRIVTQMLERKYDSLGVGGLFPLQQSKNDQRDVEIWYQMTEWTIENYWKFRYV